MARSARIPPASHQPLRFLTLRLPNTCCVRVRYASLQAMGGLSNLCFAMWCPCVVWGTIKSAVKVSSCEFSFSLVLFVTCLRHPRRCPAQRRRRQLPAVLFLVRGGGRGRVVVGSQRVLKTRPFPLPPGADTPPYSPPLPSPAFAQLRRGWGPLCSPPGHSIRGVLKGCGPVPRSPDPGGGAGAGRPPAQIAV